MNNCPAITLTKQEPEYKVNPPLTISSVETENTKKSSQMPDGSALLTDTGSNSSLKNQGINYIIHAVPRPRSSSTSDEEFIEIAVKAAQNSIILADRIGIDKLAICFIGGEIYRGSCDPGKLAEGIIRGSINQFEKCQGLKEITFVDWKSSSVKYFEKAVLEKFAREIKDNWLGKVSVMAGGGDICDKSGHGASAIVNSENAGMNWGGGISGAISNALGLEAGNVDQQRKDLMKKFNNIISGKQEEEEDNRNNSDNQTPKPNQNDNSDNSESGKDKNKPTDNQEPTIPSQENGNDHDQRPNDQNGNDNQDHNSNQEKKPSDLTISNPIKQYFKKHKVQKIELDGENWIITYKNKKESKTIPVADAPEIQDLKNYLQSRGISALDATNLEANANSSSSRPNETKYWPWILGIGGILVIGIVAWAAHKKRSKK